MPPTQEYLDHVVAIAKRYGADRVLLFGSAAENPATARDLDLAVGGVGGWEFFGMAAEMERVVPLPLDVIPLEPETTFTRRIAERGRMIYERR